MMAVVLSMPVLVLGHADDHENYFSSEKQASQILPWRAPLAKEDPIFLSWHAPSVEEDKK